MSAAPQEPHYFPGCLVLLLGEKGAPGGKEERPQNSGIPSPHLKTIVGKGWKADREEIAGINKEVN